MKPSSVLPLSNVHINVWTDTAGRMVNQESTCQHTDQDCRRSVYIFNTLSICDSQAPLLSDINITPSISGNIVNQVGYTSAFVLFFNKIYSICCFPLFLWEIIFNYHYLMLLLLTVYCKITWLFCLLAYNQDS